MRELRTAVNYLERSQFQHARMELHEHVVSLNSVEADKEKKLHMVLYFVQTQQKHKPVLLPQNTTLKPLNKSFHLPLHASFLSTCLQKRSKGQCPHGVSKILSKQLLKPQLCFSSMASKLSTMPNSFVWCTWKLKLPGKYFFKNINILNNAAKAFGTL